MKLRRWLSQRWCGLTRGHFFTRHCDAEHGWFGEQCYLCSHRKTGIEIGPQRFTFPEAPVAKRRIPTWLHSVHFGQRGA